MAPFGNFHLQARRGPAIPAATGGEDGGMFASGILRMGLGGRPAAAHEMRTAASRSMVEQSSAGSMGFVT